ncbi:MAG: hypothetical protein LAO05_14180 [Acidobacteriia bacterium]|nr:hypothetical protein [Terriglobia bacterium]
MKRAVTGYHNESNRTPGAPGIAASAGHDLLQIQLLHRADRELPAALGAEAADAGSSYACSAVATHAARTASATFIASRSFMVASQRPVTPRGRGYAGPRRPLEASPSALLPAAADRSGKA